MTDSTTKTQTIGVRVTLPEKLIFTILGKEQVETPSWFMRQVARSWLQDNGYWPVEDWLKDNDYWPPEKHLRDLGRNGHSDE